MSQSIRLFIIAACSLGVTACMVDGTNSYPDTQAHGMPGTPGTALYPEGYENITSYDLPNDNQDRESISSGQVVVPESYHVSSYQAPATAKDLDRSWVNSQNPQTYTIELANSNKAAQVARVLFKAPKNERTAEVQYQRGGREYYKGLYGTYPSYEAAQQAYNSLPEDIRQTAGIKKWSNVQNNL